MIYRVFKSTSYLHINVIFVKRDQFYTPSGGKRDVSLSQQECFAVKIIETQKILFQKLLTPYNYFIQIMSL